MMFDTSEAKEVVIELREQQLDGTYIPQRFAAAGKLVEKKFVREAILFDEANMLIGPSSTDGFKTVRMGTRFPLKKIRPLANASEAHLIPSVTPYAFRVVTKDHRSYSYTFPGEHTADFLNAETSISCDSLLTGQGKP